MVKAYDIAMVTLLRGKANTLYKRRGSKEETGVTKYSPLFLNHSVGCA